MKRYFTYMLLMVAVFQVSAQKSTNTSVQKSIKPKAEPTNLEKAKELYKAGAFEAARPMFEKEYNAKMTDPLLNEWYGVCLLKTGGDKIKAEECLTLAAKRNIPDAFLNLGDLYSQTYRFDEARAQYAKYAKLKRKDQAALAEIAAKKETMERLEKAALHPENIQIIDSAVVDKADLLSAYHLTADAGKVESYNSAFKTDQKIESTVYLNGKESKIYYSKPSTNGYSLFSKEKSYNGFGKEKQLSSTNFGFSGNLNYPFVMSDGVTVYFAAQDSMGLGGYDLYVTRYNSNNDTYLTPEMLNAPFNSNANDYLMVIDEEKGIGWFASDRFQPKGKVCIYTFIPNEKVEMLDSASSENLIDRARITAIKDSWRSSVDYSALIELAKKDVNPKATKAHDFEFVINDKYTYYHYADFKSKVARDLYFNAQDARRSYQKGKNTLTEKRDLYAKASDAERQKLTFAITDLEGRLPAMYKKINDLELQARDKEISFLKK